MNKRMELSTRRGSRHPWIFRRMLAGDTPHNNATPAVDVYNKEGRYVGTGLYSPHSMIAVRLLSASEGQPIDAEFLTTQFGALKVIREDVLHLLTEDTNCYRLVNSEGDHLSGLIVDKFDNTIVADVRAKGWFDRSSDIEKALKNVYGNDVNVLFTTAPGIEKAEKFFLTPPPGRMFQFQEHGLKYRVNPSVSHKTGFFLDQRDNRSLVRDICRGKHLLDCCCYTGGFSLNAALGGAASVTGIDLDEDAIAVGKKNAAINNLRCKFVHADVFPYLRDRARNDNSPDVLILDPPKLIPSKADFQQGRSIYADMNNTAMSILKPGAMFLSFSCSGLLTLEDFVEVVSIAAYRNNLTFQVVKILGPGADHPWMLNAPESRYLKGIFGRVVAKG